MNSMNKKTPKMPKFRNESEEADWWASPARRSYVKQKSAEGKAKGAKSVGSNLVATMNKKSSVQIAIRLPEADLANRSRRIAERKGIGYQTLLKMLVREGLVREAHRDFRSKRIGLIGTGASRILNSARPSPINFISNFRTSSPSFSSKISASSCSFALRMGKGELSEGSVESCSCRSPFESTLMPRTYVSPEI